MKEKIVNALKTRYANLGLSEKAFNGVASFLEKTITDENGIENAVAGEDVKALVTSFQAETDALRGAKASLAKEFEEYKKAHQSVDPTKVEPSSEVAKLLAEQKAELEEMKRRMKESETKATHEAMLKSVREKMVEKGCKVAPVLDLVLASASVAEGDTVDSLVEKHKASYDAKYKEFYGNGVIPPSGNPIDEGYKKGAFADQLERLKASGMIPQNK